MPIIAPNPSKEETGSISPQKLTAIINTTTVVAASAEICVFVKAEINSPTPVVAVTYNNAAKLSAQKLPFSATPNTVIASATKPKKLIILTKM